MVENHPRPVVGDEVGDFDGELISHLATRQESEHHVGEDDADVAQDDRTRRRTSDALGASRDTETVDGADHGDDDGEDQALYDPCSASAATSDSKVRAKKIGRGSDSSPAQ